MDKSEEPEKSKIYKGVLVIVRNQGFDISASRLNLRVQAEIKISNINIESGK